MAVKAWLQAEKDQVLEPFLVKEKFEELVGLKFQMVAQVEPCRLPGHQCLRVQPEVGAEAL